MASARSLGSRAGPRGSPGGGNGKLKAFCPFSCKREAKI